MSLTIPNSFSDAAVISASEVNANNSAIAAALGNIVNADVSSDAGITSEKLSDRFAVSFLNLNLVPGVTGTAVDGDAGMTTPTDTAADTASSSNTRVSRHRFRIKSGRRVELVSIVSEANDVTASGGANPVLWVYHNTTLLSGAGVTMTAALTPYYLENSSAHTAPLAVLQNGDYLDFHLGRSAAAGPPSIAGLNVSIAIKAELES